MAAAVPALGERFTPHVTGDARRVATKPSRRSRRATSPPKDRRGATLASLDDVLGQVDLSTMDVCKGGLSIEATGFGSSAKLVLVVRSYARNDNGSSYIDTSVANEAAVEVQRFLLSGVNRLTLTRAPRRSRRGED